MNNIQKLIEAGKTGVGLSDAARNAMPEIIEQDRKYRELVKLCNGHFNTHQSETVRRQTIDRIREIVGEG